MKKAALTLICAIMTIVGYAQVVVNGTVYDPTDDTVIGASVTEKGNPQTGAVTDIDGNFSIKVSSANATLVISYVGMETQEIKLDGRTHVDVHLKEAAEVLKELVVVGYGVQKKINATGSVKTIDNAVLESRPISNAVQGLQGAVAGLNITNDAGGGLGEAMNINIRGVGSIGEGSNSSPLILIDGMEGDLSTINPADIENISVLKDAAAASIYGSRAPFGVILVTTRGGQKGTRVNYTGNVRFQQPINVPRQPDSYTYALMVNDAWVNTGGSPQFGYGPLQRILRYQRGELEFGCEAMANDPTRWQTNFQAAGNTDWYDVYLKKLSMAQEHNVSVSGGGDNVTYYLSGNYLGQDGMFKHADEQYQRLALTGKVNIKFNRYVSFLWTTRLITTDNEKPSALNSLFYHNLGRRSPTIPLMTPLGEYHPDSMMENLVNGGQQKTKTQQIYNQGNVIIEPIKDWKIHVEVSSRIENNPFTRQFNPITYTRPNGVTEYLTVMDGVETKHTIRPNGTFWVYPAPGETYYEKAQTNINYFSTNVYTDYSLTLKEKHNFKFLVGLQTEYFHTETTRVASTDILLADKPFLPSDPGSGNTMAAESKGEWSSVGIFGRVNYNYDDRYMLEVNLRGDGASRFPKNQRWGVFPSFSVGWNIGQEAFWENIAQKGWQYFKLRASYGTLGNQNTTSFYPYYQQMQTTGGDVILGGMQATVLPMFDPYSTSLTWEKIENVGAGVDVGFMNNRLTGSFDWYQRTTKDMIGPAFALPGVFGANAPQTNNAELRTRGWELEVAWRDHIGPDFSYSVSASLSDYETKITKYDSTDNSIDGWYAGKKYGDIWGYNVLGIAKSDAEMNAHLANHSQSAIGDKWGGGDLMYADIDNDGSVDPGSRTLDNHGDLRIIGNTTPRFAYSFTLEAQWKWIDFRAYFQGIGKRDYFVSNGGTIGSSTFFGYGGGPYQCTLYMDHLDYFRFAGAELGANMDDPYYARLRTDANNTQISDRYLQDASYLRLKNLQIGFSLPKTTKISKYVQKARIYASVENLLTWTKLKIFDPEALTSSDDTYSGGAGKTYPQYRTFSIGLELTF